MKSEDKTIGDFKFTTTQLPAVRGFKLFSRLVKQVGPLFGAFASLGEFEIGTDISGALPALTSALAGMDPEELSVLSKDILASTMVQINDATGGRVLPLDREENVNLVFTGRLRMMVDVLLWVIGVNFSDFLPGANAPAKPTNGQTTTLTAG